MEEEIKDLKVTVARLENIIKGYRLEIDKLNHLARDIDLIKVSDVLKGQKYKQNVE